MTWCGFLHLFAVNQKEKIGWRELLRAHVVFGAPKQMPIRLNSHMMKILNQRAGQTKSGCQNMSGGLYYIE